MNPTKTKYARERAHGIRNKFIQQISGEYIKRKVKPQNVFTTEELKPIVRKIIKDFDIDKIIETVRIRKGNNFRGNFNEIVLPDLTHTIETAVNASSKIQELKEANKADELEKGIRMEKVNEEHDRVMDQAVMGNEEAALESLHAYGNAEF